MLIQVTWGGRESLPTGKALVQRLVSESECFVSVVTGEYRPKQVIIEFRGLLAAIPGMKRGKLPNQNFMNPDYRCRIDAMDILFNEQIKDIPFASISFGRTLVVVMLICGERGRVFDPSNSMETVKDWLEPPSKQVGRSKKKRRDRGWGIGLVQDDSQITPLPLHSWQTGIKHKHSTIIIKPWDVVREPTLNLVAQMLMI